MRLFTVLQEIYTNLAKEMFSYVKIGISNYVNYTLFTFLELENPVLNFLYSLSSRELLSYKLLSV